MNLSAYLFAFERYQITKKGQSLSKRYEDKSAIKIEKEWQEGVLVLGVAYKTPNRLSCPSLSAASSSVSVDLHLRLIGTHLSNMEPLIRRQSSQTVGFSGYSGYAGRPVQRAYAHSVSGGAGGHGTRISTSTVTYGNRVGSSFGGGFDYQASGAAADSLAIANEKIAMQHLNDRLASYLETVRSLEKANKSLEIKIRETVEKRGPLEGRDYSKYNAVITELRSKVSR